jgi:HlyD family secretion protein
MFRFLSLIVLLGAIVGSVFVYRGYVERHADAPPYRTEQVKRGDLLITVGATGTIEPEEVVDVGAQVMGRIKELGKDLRGKSDPKYVDKTVDYGSPVEKGMVLAQIDPAIYKAQFDQATASLAQAQANVAQMQARVLQTEAEWQRAQKLKNLKIPSRSPTGSAAASQSLPIVGISDADYILAQANAETAKADLEAAKATVLQQKATLSLAETNLGYTTIFSPISGTIIDRRVNIGQTVVSSLNAPSLFLLARDLRRMQVWASVNEADIAKIKPGTKVRFRVDAFPDDTFHGTVVQIRLNASMTQNVVIYTVVIGVDNSDLKLLPYLTADVKFEVEERKDVLLAPNAALRFHPDANQIVESGLSEKKDKKEGGGRRPRRPEASASTEGLGRLWQIDAETSKLKPIEVRTGLSDGSFTEIISDKVHEGDTIVVGEQQQIANNEVNNPFAPPRFGRSRPSTKGAN